MIKRFRFGAPILTDSVVQDVAISAWKNDIFTKDEQGETIRFSRLLQDEDIVYGLGEQVRGINKRGWIYRTRNTDTPTISEATEFSYAAHNFFLLDGQVKVGIFFDTGSEVVYDIGYEKYDKLTISTIIDFDVYIIQAETLTDIIKEFRQLIGESYIPPFWAFGFGQSRWGYKTQQDIEEVADEYQKNDFPIDMIYLDIDYMERYKDFTIDNDRFPEFEDFVSKMRKRNIRLIPIIDAAVKVEQGYGVYEEGVEKGYFCKGDDGKPFVVGVWPGDSALPDVLNKSASEWFGSQYKTLLDKGIEGFWNDMNEPHFFYSRKRVEEELSKIKALDMQKFDLDQWKELHETYCRLSRNYADYDAFYHDIDGKKVKYSKVRNLYGYNMTKSASNYFEKYNPNKKYLLFSRSSCIGMHRYGGIWTGDNSSLWSHLLLNLQMLPSLNMCGFLYAGADIGGFSVNTTEDLLLRWTALAVFTPLFRNHCTNYNRQQEYYRFDKKDVFKKFIQIRYALIPYIYSEFVKSVKQSTMLFRPLAFDYPNDRTAKDIEDQLMLGDSLMIAPVYKQNAKGRYVYLPNKMKLIRMKSPLDSEEQVLEKGHHHINVSLDEIVFFLKENCIFPLAEVVQSTNEIDYEKLKYIKFSEKKGVYVLAKPNKNETDIDIQKIEV